MSISLIKKSSLRMKLISFAVVTLISKITVFGAQKIHMSPYNSQYTHYKTLLGAPLPIFLWKLIQFRHLSHNDNPFVMVLMRMMLRFNRMMQLVTHLMPQSQTFDGRLTSRNGDVYWPPRNCYITPLDYFLRGAVKERSYADKPERIKYLRTKIRDAIAE